MVIILVFEYIAKTDDIFNGVIIFGLTINCNQL